MKKLLLLVFTGICVGSFAQINYDGKVEKRKGEMIVCPADFSDANTYIGPPSFIEDALNKKLRFEAKSTFVVTYNGFPPAAQRAFQDAVDIWSGLVSSEVPIHVSANWVDLSTNVLGSAAPGDYIRNFDGAARARTWYPMALAERMARKDLNSSTEPDIVASFNKKVNWFLAPSGAPASGQYDFTSVVLHELGHGLGFTGSFRVSGNNGTWGLGSASPFIYDHFVENTSGLKLSDTTQVKNNSAALKSEITSEALVFGGVAATKANADTKPKLYAPATYSSGSSVYHLDGATYPSGNINSLMTESAQAREVIKDPGPIVLGIFEDMGWKGTSVLHTLMSDSEDKTKPLVFTAKVVSDYKVANGSVKLVYSVNDSLHAKTTTVAMTPTAKVGEYSYALPPAPEDRTIRYHIEAIDDQGTRASSPPEAPKFIYRFKVAPDKTPPTLTHFPIASIYEGDTAWVYGLVADNIGISSVVVDWSLNGNTQTAINVPVSSSGYFETFFPLAITKGGNKFRYRVTVTDVAAAKNKAYAPSASTFNAFEVIKLNSVATSYINNFNSNVNDFVGDFSISTQTGFQNAAIHTAHPYENGSDPNSESNFVYVLKTPIKINSDSANIYFDEVVLVEPGESGSEFGDAEFYDYVVVEGSKDGVNWVPFEEGYDSRAQKKWENTFMNSLVRDQSITTINVSNSTAVGNSSLFFPRKIDMMASGAFAHNDVILIRFRLFTDQLTYGWGWAIDNLRINTSGPPPITAISSEENLDLAVYPNPSVEEVSIKTSLKEPGPVIVEVFNDKGVKALSKKFMAASVRFYEKISLADLPAGTYTMRVYTDRDVKWRRILVNH